MAVKMAKKYPLFQRKLPNKTLYLNPISLTVPRVPEADKKKENYYLTPTHDSQINTYTKKNRNNQILTNTQPIRDLLLLCPHVSGFITGKWANSLQLYSRIIDRVRRVAVLSSHGDLSASD